MRELQSDFDLMMKSFIKVNIKMHKNGKVKMS